MSITLTEQKLKHLVCESVKEVLAVEFMKLHALLVPEVSEKEQSREI